jgi:hypothetical protein
MSFFSPKSVNINHLYSDLGNKNFQFHARKESKMTVACEHVIVFFPSVNKSFLFRLGKQKFLVSHAHAQRVKNDRGMSMSFFSQV